MSLFDLSLEAHRAGRLDEAERGYRNVLTQQPRHADALHLLGLVRRERGALDEAQTLIESAIAVDAQARFFGSLGTVMLDRGRHDEAETLFRRAAELDPGDLTARFNLGVLLLDSGRPGDAQTALRQALSLDERFAPTHRELGRALHALGAHDDALAHFGRAVELDPGDALAFVGFAAVLTIAERYDEAEAASRRAIALDPALHDAHVNVGAVLLHQRRMEEAEKALRAALDIDASRPLAHLNLGTVLAEIGRLPEAESALRRAIELDPEGTLGVVGYLTLGWTHIRQQRFDEAIAVFREGLAHVPADPDLEANLGMALLTKGHFAEGWALYESRIATRHPKPNFPDPHLPFPVWRDQPLQGKSLLVLCEQGLGDALQFCRYLPLLKAKGVAHLSVVCARPLARLFEQIEGVDACLTSANPHEVPPHDFYCYMMSLPARFGTTLKTVPASTPYLRAPVDAAKAWDGKLPATRPRIGLVWAGERRITQRVIDATDQRRSMHAREFLPLLRIPGFTFVSLQLGATTRPQIEELPPELRPFDPMSEVTDFADTAAIIENLDLVIAVDTSTAHLAGALNKPVWILSRYDQCWRWLIGRDDTPWYPSARLFRQEVAGRWDDVIERVADALKGFKASPSPHARATRRKPSAPAGSRESAAPRGGSRRT
jgi:tetratricopeptide (TPR) repeat protein